MRKLLWLGLAMFAGVCGTSYYAMMHPGSMVGQCVFKAGEFGLRVNPIVVLARGIANARHQEPVSTAPVEDVVPDEPAALDEPAAKPLAGMIDLDPALQAPLIGIHEDEEPAAAGNEIASQPVDDAAIAERAGIRILAEAAAQAACPRVMPYADDEAVTPMPYAGQTEGRDPYDPALLESTPPEMKPAGTSEESEPADPKPNDNAENNMTPEYYHHDYHSRYIVCPYSGKCVEATPPSNEEPKSKKDDSKYEPAPAPVTEEQEPKPEAPTRHKKKDKKTPSEGCPKTNGCPPHPAVDTMEFRPSDDDGTNKNNGGPY